MFSFDGVMANKLLKMGSCTPPHDNEYEKYWYLNDVLVACDQDCHSDCNGTSPALTRLLVTEISRLEVLGGDNVMVVEQ